MVSFSFFEGGTERDSLVRHPERDYLEGVATNLKSVRELYPGWTMRLYHNIPKDSGTFELLCKMACEYAELDLCDAYNLPGTPVQNASGLIPTMWRYLPTLDPQVNSIPTTYFVTTDQHHFRSL